jgi:hypothetical protein
MEKRRTQTQDPFAGLHSKLKQSSQTISHTTIQQGGSRPAYASKEGVCVRVYVRLSVLVRARV